MSHFAIQGEGFFLLETPNGNRLSRAGSFMPAADGNLVNPDGYRLLDASRGGFARLDGRLARFIVEFETASGVALEPLYTGKLLLALREAVESGAVARGSRLVALHSGGLQGRRALQERLLALL